MPLRPRGWYGFKFQPYPMGSSNPSNPFVWFTEYGEPWLTETSEDFLTEDAV